ncbi:MAG: formate--tetrahydrofolate ligase [Chloroflexota bacterium]
MTSDTRRSEPRPINEIARHLDVRDSEILPYGQFAAKLDATALRKRLVLQPEGRFVVVTGMTPTPPGEGKTLTTIGLTMALNRIGTRTAATLRQPSLGPVFGLKGGASGSGRAEVIPSELMNLHLTGDFHAITAAHNLLSAVIDSQLVQDNPHGLDPLAITWPRVLDINDRALRHITTGLGGRLNGQPRETRFDITATSEIMSVLGLSRDLAELKQRIGAITVGSAMNGQPVTVADIGIAGALTALLRDAINPNLLQTSEHTPAFVHSGPFANISYGNSSVIADLLALKLADCVVTESGFGSDLGFEKMMHIKAPVLGRYPDAAVLVSTVRALKYHSGGGIADPLEAVRAGFPNLRQHIENIRRFGLPVVVAVNRFTGDTDAELELTRELALDAGATDAQVSSAWAMGGEGAEGLARAVLAAFDGEPPTIKLVAAPEAPLQEKIQAIATTVYGAAEVSFSPRATRQLRVLTDQGLGHLPVCMAKTPLSLSDNPKVLGRPAGFTLTVHELRPYTGAGYVTALCGDILTMPGLPKAAAVYGIDVDEDGQITGLS